ncbi:MAG: hypothetical protein KDE20_02040 [Caldilineaceae bacterium]|nr:hypothetical protein [Caldilineaceae bacterium]
MSAKIDGPSLSPEMLIVRGLDLNAIVGTHDYVSAVYHLLTGAFPTTGAAATLDRWLLDNLCRAHVDAPLSAQVRAAAASGATPIGATVAALAVADGRGDVALPALPADLGLELYRDGLYYFSLLPLFWATAVAVVNADDGAGATPPPLDDAHDYLDAVFILARGRRLETDAARTVFDAVMTAFHAGFGGLTPTTMAPRTAASVRTSVPMALAAGYTAAGPLHVGACQAAMTLFQRMVQQASGDLDSVVHATLARLDEAGRRVPGFGHPLFKRDPRVAHLRAIIRSSGLTSPYLTVFDTLAATLEERHGIYPNIDSMAAAAFLTLGIAPAFGTGLFLSSRAAAMVVHIQDALEEQPFGGRSETLRAWLQQP